MEIPIERSMEVSSEVRAVPPALAARDAYHLQYDVLLP